MKKRYRWLHTTLCIYVRYADRLIEILSFSLCIVYTLQYKIVPIDDYMFMLMLLLIPYVKLFWFFTLFFKIKRGNHAHSEWVEYQLRKITIIVNFPFKKETFFLFNYHFSFLSYCQFEIKQANESRKINSSSWEKKHNKIENEKLFIFIVCPTLFSSLIKSIKSKMFFFVLFRIHAPSPIWSFHVKLFQCYLYYSYGAANRLRPWLFAVKKSANMLCVYL